MSDPDKPKAMARTASHADGIAAGAVAAVRTLGDKLPVLGWLTKFAKEAEAEYRARRMEAWSAAVAGDEDPQAFSARLEQALNGPDASLVRAAIVDSTRAAVDALDDEVVPAIARLTNLYVTSSKSPDRRMFRDLLAFLKSLDGEEYTAFRSALSTIAKVSHDRHRLTAGFFDTACTFESPRKQWCWFVYILPNAGTEDPISELLVEGEVALRVVTALQRADGALFNAGVDQGVLASLDGEPPLRSVKAPPFFTAEMIDLLARICEV